MQNLGGTSKKCTYFSSRARWARKMLQFTKNAFREKTMRFFADQWVICLVFGWFQSGLVCLWVVGLVYGWLVGGLASLQLRHGVKVGPGPRDLPQSLKVGPHDPLQNFKVGSQDPLQSLKVEPPHLSLMNSFFSEYFIVFLSLCLF